MGGPFWPGGENLGGGNLFKEPFDPHLIWRCVFTPRGEALWGKNFSPPEENFFSRGAPETFN